MASNAQREVGLLTLAAIRLLRVRADRRHGEHGRRAGGETKLVPHVGEGTGEGREWALQRARPICRPRSLLRQSVSWRQIVRIVVILSEAKDLLELGRSFVASLLR